MKPKAQYDVEDLADGRFEVVDRYGAADSSDYRYVAGPYDDYGAAWAVAETIRREVEARYDEGLKEGGLVAVARLNAYLYDLVMRPQTETQP